MILEDWGWCVRLACIAQENLVKSLVSVLKSTVVPPDILQTLLNLAEFMEHEVRASTARELSCGCAYLYCDGSKVKLNIVAGSTTFVRCGGEVTVSLLPVLLDHRLCFLRADGGV